MTVQTSVKFTRVWAMPDAYTFRIPVIRELVLRYTGDGKGWADPFAGQSTLAEFSNDLDPKSPAKNHYLAFHFARILPRELKGVHWDPPYSYRQVTEHYKAFGRKASQDDTNNFFYSSVRKELVPKIRAGGIVISCGWNTQGFGLNNGFELIEILDVCHGFHHNDTLVVVEKKVQDVLRLDFDEPEIQDRR